MLTLEQLFVCGVGKLVASEIAAKVNPLLASLPAPDCWREISRNILEPQHPFALHKLLYDTTYAEWDSKANGAPPAWFPNQDDIVNANITRLMEVLQIETYPEFHAWTVKNRNTFWQTMIDTLRIKADGKGADDTPAATVRLIDTVSGSTVMPDFNITDSCFHAPDNALAIITQHEGDERLFTLTYQELEILTNRVANGLVGLGMAPGDAIAIDMPMNVESVAIYLGIIKAGGVVVSIADSFAPDEITTRLRIGRAKGIFTQDYIDRGGKRLPLYEKIIAANAPRAILLGIAGDVSCRRGQDMAWHDFLSDAETFSAVPGHPESNTNILFSSGTTAAPKAIPWTHTTPIKCAADAFLHHDIHPGDVLAWPTNLGWMMGPWLIYASLINSATIALYDGLPTTSDFGAFIQRAKVNMLGVVPTLVRAWKNGNCLKGLDWSAIRTFSSTGECSNPTEMLFLMSRAGYRPVIEYCGGTEIGGAYITGTRIQPAAPSTFTTPALGLDFRLFDETGQPTDNGEAFIVPPSLGLSKTLLNAEHHHIYFSDTPKPNLRRHGDALQCLSNGYYRIHGRVDDTMNLSGIKVSSAEIEEVLNTVPDIQETAALAVTATDGGPSQLVIYAVLKTHVAAATHDDIHRTLQATLSERLNPLFRVHEVIVVEALPRTASNKVMRRLLRQQL